MYDNTYMKNDYGRIEISFIDEKNDEYLAKISKAYSSKVRLKMIRQIELKPRTIYELSKLNGVDNTTIMFHLNILLNAKIIRELYLPNKKGHSKFYSLEVVDVHLTNQRESIPVFTQYEEEIPIGMYSKANFFNGFITVSDGKICHFNNSEIYSSKRMNALVIYTQDGGSLTYSFSSNFLSSDKKIQSITFSFEICSETYAFRNDYQSDIFIMINNKDACMHTCKGDYGGMRGILTPEWWPNNFTQYGDLVIVEINNDGTFLNHRLVSALKLSDLELEKNKPVELTIENRKDCLHFGGFNIFGKNFGNIKQDIKMVVTYKK